MNTRARMVGIHTDGSRPARNDFILPDDSRPGATNKPHVHVKENRSRRNRKGISRLDPTVRYHPASGRSFIWQSMMHISVLLLSKQREVRVHRDQVGPNITAVSRCPNEHLLRWIASSTASRIRGHLTINAAAVTGGSNMKR